MLEEIKTLPPLPETVVKIQELCMQQDADIDDLSRVVEHDPMLSANILKSVNSPLYGMSKEISSIPQAIMLFGISMIRGFAAASAIKKTISVDLSPYDSTVDELTHISSLQTALAREWYRNVDKTKLPLLQSCAFLMELGKLVGSHRVIAAKNVEKFSKEILNALSFDEIERNYIGLSSYEIAAEMFEHWNFESTLIEALREISNPSTQNPYAQALAVITKTVALKKVFSDDGIAEALALIERFGLDKNAFEEAVRSVQSMQELS